MFKQNPSIFFFFRVEVYVPLSSTDVKFLIKGEWPSLSMHLFYEPRLWYIVNQSGAAKETVSPKIGKNIEMLVCFIYMGTQDSTLIGISYHYQITMNQHKN